MDWIAELNDVGCALTPSLLTPKQCEEISGWYAEVERFRATIDMARYRFGSGHCHRAGQERPTPILLKYQAGDWNALHRDLYGDLVFPLQVVIGLDRPGVDYEGGEFLLVEQRPRAQSRATVTSLPQGRGLIFTTRDRPVQSTRGWSAAPVRHGVSTVRSGLRHTLGLVLHDAT